ncbi:MAG: hypothetical protein PHU85_15150 [Phycisphaerae bacterium]|nr:hypothetical protein [Phycisphaerae bacterium]
MASYYVNGDTGDDGTGDGSVGAPYKTVFKGISQAVTDAATGPHTVLVQDTASHEYQEDVAATGYFRIQAQNPATLVTVQPDGYVKGAVDRARTITLRGATDPNFGGIRFIDASNIKVQGFKLGHTGAYQCVQIQGATNTTDITITDNELIAAAVAGGDAPQGITMWSGAGAVDSSGWTITDNLFTLTQPGAVPVGSVMHGGIAIKATSGGDGSDDWVVTGNIFNIDSAYAKGIMLFPAAGASLDDWVIANNTFNMTAKRTRTVIEIGHDSDGDDSIERCAVYGNTINGYAVTQEGHGIVVGGGSVEADVHDNIIHDCNIAIVAKSCLHARIYRNSMWNSRYGWIHVKGAHSSFVFDNDGYGTCGNTSPYGALSVYSSDTADDATDGATGNVVVGNRFRMKSDVPVCFIHYGRFNSGSVEAGESKNNLINGNSYVGVPTKAVSITGGGGWNGGAPATATYATIALAAAAITWDDDGVARHSIASENVTWVERKSRRKAV